MDVSKHVRSECHDPQCPVCKAVARSQYDMEVIGMDTRLAQEPKLRQREGDQALPTVNDFPICHEMVCTDIHTQFAGHPHEAELLQDIRNRLALGERRYGHGLQPFNGRQFTRDTYEEVLDTLAYSRGKMYELSHGLQAMSQDVRALYYAMHHHYQNTLRFALFLRECLSEGK